MFWRSAVLIEPGSSGLLRLTAQPFLAKSVRLIYYVSPSTIFSEHGSSDLLCFSAHSGRWLKIGGDLWESGYIGGG